jgi:hypothetical protein
MPDGNQGFLAPSGLGEREATELAQQVVKVTVRQ